MGLSNVYFYHLLSSQDGGQECCYDDDGFLLNVALSDGGGYSYRYHQDGVSPYGEPSKVSRQKGSFVNIAVYKHMK